MNTGRSSQIREVAATALVMVAATLAVTITGAKTEKVEAIGLTVSIALPIELIKSPDG